MTRVLWMSNAPWAKTGYGDQTLSFCATMTARGHEVAVLANFGLQATRMDIGINGRKVAVYPMGKEMYSNDVVQATADDFEADVVITLYDAWPLKFAALKGHQTPWVAWAPIDHETITPGVLESLKRADRAIAYSRHGQRAMLEGGLEDALYIPHGVNTEIFTPGDMAAAREKMGLPGVETFLVGMVAANNYYPSRKCIPQALCAFADFKKRTGAKTAIYLHMVDDESNGGIDIRRIAKALGLKFGEDYFLPDPYELRLGIPTPAMVGLYQAFDVLLNPSYGEGFGIPILEAMACGTPPIVTRGTSMTELAVSCGWLVNGEAWWSQQGAFQTMPSIAGIERALTEMYMVRFGTPDEWKHKQELCRQRALGYDWEKVVAPMWDEFLKGEGWKRKSDPVGLETAGHVHRWGNTGLWIERGAMALPCMIAGCDAYQEVGPGREPVIHEHGFYPETDLVFEDDPAGGVAKIVLREIQDDYKLAEMGFQPGDQVIDIGAHVGVVSCYIAKNYPGTLIYAFEPVQENFERLALNLERNGIGKERVRAFPLGVTGDGREITLVGDGRGNSGGWSAAGVHSSIVEQRTARSTTLEQILLDNAIDRVKLLKVDCEGSEYEILYSAPEWAWKKIEYVAIEIHDQGPHYPHGQKLVSWLQDKLGNKEKVFFKLNHVDRLELPAEVGR